MKDSHSKTIGTFLDTDNRDLQSVFAKIKQIQDINAKVMPYIDVNIAPYCQVANVLGKRLILIAANGSVATQIRFQTLDLLRKFKQNPALSHIQEIQCKVRPAQTPAIHRPMPRQLKSMQKLSTETAEIVRDIATTIDDPKLREIMLKIANNVRDHNSR